MQTLARIGVTIVATTAVMVLVLALFGAILDGGTSFEAMAVLSAVALGYITIGCVVVGLPILLLVRKSGLREGSFAFFCAAGLAGAAASAVLTFLLFLDAPEVALALFKMAVPLGFLGGLTAACIWQRLSLQTAQHPR